MFGNLEKYERVFSNPYDPLFVHEEVEKMKNSGFGSHALMNEYLLRCCSKKEEYTLIAEKLIESGADVNCKNKQLTPLILCSMNGHENILKMLIGEGCCHIDDQNEDGNSALHIAVLRNKFFCVKELLSSNASDLSRNYAGQLPSELSTYKFVTDLFLKRDLRILVEKKSQIGRKEMKLENEIRETRGKIDMYRLQVEGLEEKIEKLAEERKKMMEMKEIFGDRIVEISKKIGINKGFSAGMTKIV